MSKMNQVYGIGQGLILSLPPPVHFQNAPTAAQDQYEVGQISYTGTSGAYTFYIYAGAGVWELLDVGTGNIVGVNGTTNQITASTTLGVVTLSIPSTFIAPGSIASTTTNNAGTSMTAATTITATLGNITATNGNFVATTSGTGILLTSSQASGAASGPVIVNGRSGRATFTSVSIAAAADLTLTITNSSITASTTEVMLSMSGATTGSALSIKSKTASSGSLAIVVTNGTGASTTTADIQIDFLVLNA